MDHFDFDARGVTSGPIYFDSDGNPIWKVVGSEPGPVEPRDWPVTGLEPEEPIWWDIA